MSLNNILQELNLGHLINKFNEENITIDLIGTLTTDDFKSLGILKLGDISAIRFKCRSHQSNANYNNNSNINNNCKNNLINNNRRPNLLTRRIMG